MKLQQTILRLGLLSLVACAQYPYAAKLKMVSFDNNLAQGTSVGNIRGEDCTWTVMGQQLGGNPTIDKAFINAKNQAGAWEAAGFTDGKAKSQGIRYVNNVTTTNEGFNAMVVGKKCLVVTGVGYR